MIEPTEEMRAAFLAEREDGCDEVGCGRAECLDVRLAAVLAIVERDRAAELTELRALFQLQWTRSREADARWRADDPEARANVWPDLGVLLKWLMDDADQLRAVLDKLLDPHACHYDHDGDCQEHGTLGQRPCPHARAKELLGWSAP